MENLTLWCGIACLAVSFLAVIAVFLTRKNIKDIIDRDIIFFEKNFEIKKDAITSALDVVDEISLKGKSVIRDITFVHKAKQCYNNLLCVVSNIKLAKEFYDITLNTSKETTSLEIAKFKLACRKDIGFKTKKFKSSDLPLQSNPQEQSFSSQSFQDERPVASQVRPVQTRPIATQTQMAKKVGRPTKE